MTFQMLNKWNTKHKYIAVKNKSANDEITHRKNHPHPNISEKIYSQCFVSLSSENLKFH